MDEYQSELLTSEECDLHRQAKKGIRRGQNFVKVAPERLEAILVELDKLRLQMIDIRDLARTGLPLPGYTDEQWTQHRLNMIAAMADNQHVEVHE